MKYVPGSGGTIIEMVRSTVAPGAAFGTSEPIRSGDVRLLLSCPSTDVGIQVAASLFVQVVCPVFLSCHLVVNKELVARTVPLLGVVLTSCISSVAAIVVKLRVADHTLKSGPSLASTCQKY